MLVQTVPRSHDQGIPVLSWLTFERRSWLALAVVTGLAGFGIGNGHTTQDAIQDVSQKLGQKSVQVQKLQTFANCEHRRAIVTKRLATQAIISADSATVPTPDVSAIPPDCPHPITK